MMKKYVFDNFRAFFIIFDHENVCASMCTLVEIHITQIRERFELDYRAKPTKATMCLNYHQLGEKVNDYMSGAMQILLELKRNIIYLKQAMNALQRIDKYRKKVIQVSTYKELYKSSVFYVIDTHTIHRDCYLQYDFFELLTHLLQSSL